MRVAPITETWTGAAVAHDQSLEADPRLNGHSVRCVVSDNNGLWACSSGIEEAFELWRLDEEQDLSPVYRLASLEGPRSDCPPHSEVAQICPDHWSLVEATIPSWTIDDDQDDSDDDNSDDSDEDNESDPPDSDDDSDDHDGSDDSSQPNDSGGLPDWWDDHHDGQGPDEDSRHDDDDDDGRACSTSGGQLAPPLLIIIAAVVLLRGRLRPTITCRRDRRSAHLPERTDR